MCIVSSPPPKVRPRAIGQTNFRNAELSDLYIKKLGANLSEQRTRAATSPDRMALFSNSLIVSDMDVP